MIVDFSKPSQWKHVSTDCNTADLATREFHASDLPWSMWIDGPTFLHLVDADADREVKEVNITCLKTSPNQVLNGKSFQDFPHRRMYKELLLT